MRRILALAFAAFLAAACTDHETRGKDAVTPSPETVQEYAAYAYHDPADLCKFVRDTTVYPAVIGWIHVDTLAPDSPPEVVHFPALDRGPGMREENEAYRHVLRAECGDYESIGVVPFVALEAVDTTDQWTEYVYVHPSTRVNDAWFFTFWHNEPPTEKSVDVYARLYVRNKWYEEDEERDRRILNDWVVLTILQDSADVHGSYSCAGCNFRKRGDLRCLEVTLCPIP